MDVPTYQKLADEAYRRVERAFEEVDPDVADCEVAGDVVTITLKGKTRCVLNTQRPTRQLWLAAGARAWHFDYDAANGAWKDDKGQGELFETLARVVKEHAGVDVAFA